MSAQNKKTRISPFAHDCRGIVYAQSFKLLNWMMKSRNVNVKDYCLNRYAMRFFLPSPSGGWVRENPLSIFPGQRCACAGKPVDGRGFGITKKAKRDVTFGLFKFGRARGFEPPNKSVRDEIAAGKQIKTEAPNLVPLSESDRRLESLKVESEDIHILT